MDREGLGKRVLDRVGQSVMTCPTTACFDGLQDAEKSVAMGGALRYFGDGFQASKVIAGRRFWRIPVMEGEFLVSETAGVGRGVGGGNLVIGADDDPAALAAAQAAAQAMRGEGIALPFPGGIVRSGSKVGSLTSSSMPASTNHQMAPTLRAQVQDTLVPDGVGAMYEIVIDGCVRTPCARRCAAACTPPPAPGPRTSPPPTSAASSESSTSRSATCATRRDADARAP